jgi:FkbH-like protein
VKDNRSTFILRNYTVEPLFKDFSEVAYSGYEDISNVPSDVSIYIWFYSCPVNESELEIIEKLNDYKQKLDLVLLSCNPASYVLLFTLTPLTNFSFQTNKTKIIESVTAYNQHLISIAGSRQLTRVIEFEDFIKCSKNQQIIDWRYYFMYKTLINPALSDCFSAWFRRQWLAIEGKRKKCLVLDLDNTLWGGVLGEDGIEGIKLGNSYPGNVFKAFQNMLLEASKFGVLLTIVSKNNEDEVWEAFDNHPDMILKKSHFVAWRINWNDKANNIREIIDELNIGIDSVVYIDDSPVERNWISQALPEVIVPDFPQSQYQLISFFQDVYNSYFQLYDLTVEDHEKLLQYKQNSLRQQSQIHFTKIEDYIASLDIQISIKEADKFTIPRIAQLTQKTNQFNLTTHRYTDSDIANLISSGHKVYSASVTDKFGDNGITAICIMKKISTDKIEIDSYLLSCRILGRFIEFALIKKLLNMAFDNGINEVYASFISTAKNGQSALFFDKLGFEVIENVPYKKYFLKINKHFEIEPYYRFVII